MLAQVAGRIFWMSRYLERSESMARMVNAYSQLIMDLPRGAELEWSTLLNIFGVEDTFRSRELYLTEYSVMQFLIARINNNSSLKYSVKKAQENARITRTVLTEEVWETINELQIYVNEFSDRSVSRKNRYLFLDEVVGRCQMVNGLMITNQCRDHVYRFSKVGHLLERIDLNVRTIDTLSYATSGSANRDNAFDTLIWAGMLRSLSTLGMYRRSVGPMVDAQSAINFVVSEETLPRSTIFCLKSIRSAILDLKNNKGLLRVVDSAIRSVGNFNASKMRSKKSQQSIARLYNFSRKFTEEATKTLFLPRQT
ncbi:MAG: alpha-E domain-containing protein [Pseudohongiellaceae bacterium]|mgnify:FL=1|jgi:uncharacterized alpha-E superfamily protein|nr:hypothetical protein [Gammaproteobacteria bacterium]|tara:strand:- start:1522 stop:2454 length:933 start_codon:yes stop_codon:yes gene_type:complete